MQGEGVCRLTNNLRKIIRKILSRYYILFLCLFHTSIIISIKSYYDMSHVGIAMRGTLS